MSKEQVFKNTDRELYREPLEPGESYGTSYYKNSLHVTKEGGIGINVGGYVYVKTLKEWHDLAGGQFPEKVREALEKGE